MPHPTGVFPILDQICCNATLCTWMPDTCLQWMHVLSQFECILLLKKYHKSYVSGFPLPLQPATYLPPWWPTEVSKNCAFGVSDMLLYARLRGIIKVLVIMYCLR